VLLVISHMAFRSLLHQLRAYPNLEGMNGGETCDKNHTSRFDSDLISTASHRPMAAEQIQRILPPIPASEADTILVWKKDFLSSRSPGKSDKTPARSNTTGTT